MAIRFAQKHVEKLPLGNLTTEQFLSWQLKHQNQLGWVLGDINKTGFIAYTNNGLFSWNAEVKLKIKNETAQPAKQVKGR